MSTAISAPGTAPVVVPGPGPIPVLVSVPASTRHVVLSWERVNAIVDGIVFYGLLLFGLSTPVVGAIYAYLHR